ncbi:MAG: prolyl oligopeptidase family serine peptidase [Pseudomonadota bacterium]
MKNTTLTIAVVSLVLAATGCSDEPAASAQSAAEPAPEAADAAVPEAAAVTYPTTATVEQQDTYHGEAVADPYRWLEDDVRESEAVAEWVSAQNAVTFGYLDRIAEREPIRERLTQLWDYERYSIPTPKAGKYFFTYNDGLTNQSQVLVTEKLDGEARLLVDPNTWSEDGTVALADYEVSPDGRYLALAVQDGGSDWRTLKVLDVETGATLSDEVSWAKFTPMAWSGDSRGFYYSRYPAPDEDGAFQDLNMNQQVYYHEVGTSQDADRQVFGNPEEPEWGFFPSVTEDGRYLVITIWKGTDSRYQIAWQDLTDPEAKPTMLIEGFEYDYSLVGNIGSKLIFRTDRDAPNGRLISIDLAGSGAQEPLIETRDQVLEGAALVGERLVTAYLKDARSEVRIHALDGTFERELELPGIGTAGGFVGSMDDPNTFYSYSSFNAPSTIYRYNVQTGEREVFRQADVAFDPDDYVVRQVFFDSADGTRVPMFISHRKDLAPGGEHPTLLYGYGGFNVSVRPAFSITRLAWMEMGGIYAVANLRGGGEYGQAWHKAGTKLNKQNVFDDFIGAAEYLVEQRWTTPDELAVFGGSNGGLLVGAVVNQRPDLFAAAVPAVGVMDMLRFHQFTAGRFWVDDYGSADNPEEFAALKAYSPYHNIREGVDYPAIMVTTADTDDRVVPGHSFKYAARLQAANPDGKPMLIRIEERAGHGAGKPTDKTIAEYADRWGFLVEHLDMTLPEGYGQPEAASGP